MKAHNADATSYRTERYEENDGRPYRTPAEIDRIIYDNESTERVKESGRFDTRGDEKRKSRERRRHYDKRVIAVVCTTEFRNICIQHDREMWTRLGAREEYRWQKL